MGMRERIRKVYEWSGMSAAQLEKETGIDRYTWGNLLNLNKKVRANEDHISAIDKLFPQFSYWIATGRTQTEAGNISPEIDSARRDCEQTQKAG